MKIYSLFHDEEVASILLAPPLSLLKRPHRSSSLSECLSFLLFPFNSLDHRLADVQSHILDNEASLNEVIRKMDKVFETGDVFRLVCESRYHFVTTYTNALHRDVRFLRESFASKSCSRTEQLSFKNAREVEKSRVLLDCLLKESVVCTRRKGRNH